MFLDITNHAIYGLTFVCFRLALANFYFVFESSAPDVDPVES